MRIFSAAVVLALIIVLGIGAYVAYAHANSRSIDASYTVLAIRNPPSLDVALDHFKTKIQALGYRVTYVEVSVGPDLASTESVVSSALSQAGHVDLVVPFGVLAAKAAKAVVDKDAPGTPILFAVVSDPVDSGLVTSLTHPGANVTGVTPVNDLIASKRLEFLKEMLPNTKRIVYAWNDPNTSGIYGLRVIAPQFGFNIADHQEPTPADIAEYLKSFEYEPGDAILRASDAAGATSEPQAISIALAKKVPLIGTNAGDTERGALMSYGADYGQIGEQAAQMAAWILAGENPGDIAVEDATYFQLSVNLATARTLGIQIPQAFLAKARIIDR